MEMKVAVSRWNTNAKKNCKNDNAAHVTQSVEEKTTKSSDSLEGSNLTFFHSKAIQKCIQTRIMSKLIQALILYIFIF